MIKQTPSWTMTSRKFYTHQEITPGPGAYSNPSSSPGPNFKIGTSPRLFLGNNDLTPGPGSYSPQKMLPAQPKA
jgi:outer membrane receptor for ferric coprogen and ferric-rhodotorulic acid